MPELGTSGSVGGPGWATAQVYPPGWPLGRLGEVLTSSLQVVACFR